MEAIYMSAGILTAIILCIVGLVKLPFEGFKKKNPKAYKATFTILSILLTFGAVVLNHVFILNDVLFNTGFFVLLLSTYAGVFGLYLSYEGLGAKALVKRLIENIKKAIATAPANKYSKYLNKFEEYLNKIDLTEAEKLLNAKKEALANQTVEVQDVKVENAVVENTIVENAVIENQVINAEHVEIKSTELKKYE